MLDGPFRYRRFCPAVGIDNGNHWFFFLSSACNCSSPPRPLQLRGGAFAAMRKSYTETVIRMKVAGIKVPPSLFWFCEFASSTSCACNSPALPFFAAASTAFMVGP